MKARDRERAAEEKAAATALAAQRAQERAEWGAANGSDFLKKALGAGYNCQQRYAHEHPEYVIDYFNTAEWQDRSCPSETALDEALRMDGVA
ncbi:hypothetical protein ASF71_22095 [Deinococcus sp. Leaf326]|nr:hypothetical protein ASF71_22095 [Deinococcus sp. Leaf326]